MHIFKFLFSSKGRINRKKLLMGNIILMVQFVIASFSGLALDNLLGKIIMASSFLILFFAIICLVVKRYHDIDRSGWYLLPGVIPIIGLYFGLYLLYFVPGNPEPNKYGNPPES